MRNQLDGRHHIVKGTRPLTAEEIPPAARAKLHDRLRENASGCLVWRGAINSDGYGVMRLTLHPSRIVLVHRAVAALALGLCPADRHVDHTCHTRACANADHLRLVTPEENTPGIYEWADEAV